MPWFILDILFLDHGLMGLAIAWHFLYLSLVSSNSCCLQYPFLDRHPTSIENLHASYIQWFFLDRPLDDGRAGRVDSSLGGETSSSQKKKEVRRPTERINPDGFYRSTSCVRFHVTPESLQCNQHSYDISLACVNVTDSFAMHLAN